MSKPDEHFLKDEQKRWALLGQMSNRDEHFLADEQQKWAPFQMSNPDQHFILNDQARWALAFELSSPEMLKRDQNFLLRYWIKGKGRIAIFPATQYTGAGVQVIIFFYFRWANQMSTFFFRWANQTSTFFVRWENQMSTFFQGSKPDEHFFFRWANQMSTIPQVSKARWAPFYQMSKLRWAPCIFRWALFTFEMSTCPHCG